MTEALVVTSSFLPGRGGIESYLADLCSQLGPRVAVMAPAERDGQALPTDLSYETLAGPGSMLVPTPGLAEAIARAAAKRSTDKVLFGTPWPLILLGPRLKRRGLRYASLAFGAEVLVPGSVPYLRSRLTQALGGADLLLPMSQYTSGRLRSLLAGRGTAVPEIEVLHARVNPNRFTPTADHTRLRSRMHLTDDDKIVLYFGRLVKRKGVHRLLQAWPELTALHPDAVLVVAGTGPEERQLRRLASRTEGRAVFMGRVPDEEVPALYAAADVFVLPVVDRWFGLETEGLGVVLLEAQACGTPCVTGRSGGTVEAVIHGVTGYSIDASDRSALLSSLTRLLNDPENARRMGAAGREFVLREFPLNHLPENLTQWLG